MKRKLDCILLIDDSEDDNFFHSRVITKADVTEKVVSITSGQEALDRLKPDGSDVVKPDLIFLDINMPKMNGWEFIDQYEKLKLDQRKEIVVMMLSTSLNPDDRKRAERLNAINGFNEKPLTREVLLNIIGQHFPNRL